MLVETENFASIRPQTIGQKEDPKTKKMEDVIKRVTVPEFNMSLLEMLAPDMGVTRVTEHCNMHLQNLVFEKSFVEHYTKYVTPIYKSGK